MKSRFVALGSALLAACCPSNKPPPTAPTHCRRVVLVHGFLETGSAFRPLQERLKARGFHCLCVKLRPSDGRGGLERLAQGLKRDIDATYGPRLPISIVAFSMGGLVSRYYLQNLGGATRCDQFFTVSSPHHGTLAAWCYPTLGACQMRPGSPFLRALEETESHLGSMPVVSYRTPLDLIILPSTSSIWSRAENISHPSPLHPTMLSSFKILNDIERRLCFPPTPQPLP